MSQPFPQNIYQQVMSSGSGGLPKLIVPKLSGDSLEWPEWSEHFDVIVLQRPLSDTEGMQYLKISVAGQAKAAISGLGLSSQPYYQAWDVLSEK